MSIPLTLICLTILKLTTSAPQNAYSTIQHKIYNPAPQESQNVPHYTKLGNEQNRRLQDERGFRPTTVGYDDYDEEEDNAPASSQVTSARAQTYDDEANYAYRNSLQLINSKPYARPNQQQLQQQFKKRPAPAHFKPQLDADGKERLVEEEKEEPDRLGLLLPQSKFNCVGKNTGYYADEGLGCEVFHYCQDNAKHSWICPEGFTFHQVHLICMPPGNDNICETSSKYHFVNEYLYKPLNLEEYQSKPNVSLRYSERYYPDKFHYSEYEDEEEEQPQPVRKQPIRVQLQQTPIHHPQLITSQRRAVPVPTSYTPTFRADTTVGQVFRSPEDVNIPLQQRRPPYISQRYVSESPQY